MEVLLYGFEFLFGYAITALAYYFNHRFLFHKRLPKQVPKIIRDWHRKYANLHIQHHKHAWPEDERVKEFIKVPIFGKVILLLIVAAVGVISASASLGILIFFAVYGMRHSAIHGVSIAGNKVADSSSYYYRHHMLHHTNGNWHKHNFSGVHPWIDKVFGTYKES